VPFASHDSPMHFIVPSSVMLTRSFVVVLNVLRFGFRVPMVRIATHALGIRGIGHNWLIRIGTKPLLVSQVPKSPVIAFTIALGIGLGIVVIGASEPLKPGVGAVLVLLVSLACVPPYAWLRHPGLTMVIELGVGVFLAIIIANWLHGVGPLTSPEWYYQALRILITPLARLTP